MKRASSGFVAAVMAVAVVAQTGCGPAYGDPDYLDCQRTSECTEKGYDYCSMHNGIGHCADYPVASGVGETTGHTAENTTGDSATDENTSSEDDTTCVPSCDGSRCGNDGCGGKCVCAASGAACTPDGSCVDRCGKFLDCYTRASKYSSDQLCPEYFGVLDAANTCAAVSNSSYNPGLCTGTTCRTCLRNTSVCKQIQSLALMCSFDIAGYCGTLGGTSGYCQSLQEDVAKGKGGAGGANDWCP